MNKDDCCHATMTRVKTAMTSLVAGLFAGGVMLAVPAAAAVGTAPNPEPVPTTATATATSAPSPTFEPMGGVGCCKR